MDREAGDQLCALTNKLAPSYAQTSQMADPTARQKKRNEHTCTCHTALSQVMYTSRYPALPGEDTNVTPGFSQHNSYY